MEHDTGYPAAGVRIKTLRRLKRMTAAELARRAGVSENAIRKIEAGHSKEPRFSTGIRIAQALDVEPAAIGVDGNLDGFHSKSVPANLGSIIARIRLLRDALAREGVEHVSVFGSVARGEAEPGSDVDLIVDPIPDSQFSLFNLAAVTELFVRALGFRVDVLTRQSVNRAGFRDAAEAEAVNAF